MKEKSVQVNVRIDPIGAEMYRKVLRKPLFDKHHPPPLVGVREFTINHLFAKVWSRSRKEIKGQTISLRERRLITLALLAARGSSDQLKEHITGAFRAGIAESEVFEVMIHVAHYAGWPAGANGQEVVQDVYRKKKRQKG
jgi:4-carboxymuconolactone decarboxylase